MKKEDFFLCGILHRTQTTVVQKPHKIDHLFWLGVCSFFGVQKHIKSKTPGLLQKWKSRRFAVRTDISSSQSCRQLCNITVFNCGRESCAHMTVGSSCLTTIPHTSCWPEMIVVHSNGILPPRATLSLLMQLLICFFALGSQTRMVAF